VALAEWREHQGRRYLYISHAGTEQDTLANIDRALALLRESGSHEVPLLGNITGAFGTDAVMEGIRRFAKESDPFVSRRAVVGLRGIQKVLFLTFNTLLRVPSAPRSTEAEALEYLFPDRLT
jgi:hypothetical protein